MENFQIGHYTDLEKGTGCTVILCPEGSKAAGCARGISPGTREFALLSPFRKVEEVNAIFLTGGSAFGLDAASGVMRYLAEKGRGYPTPLAKIPIVPAAVIYDLVLLDPGAFPTPENAYQACQAARSGSRQQGTIGAGTGATVGKWAGLEFMMKGGIGIASCHLNELWVETLAVVNPVGDIIEATGNILAGAQRQGDFIARTDPTLRWKTSELKFGQNTILIVLMTNANLNKLQLYYLAERAHNGIVRAVIPAHTSYDGDLVFALSLPQIDTEIDQVSEMATETTRQSIIQGVLKADSLGGIPAVGRDIDLPRE
jgi:L-aminopeptidase/D-esterase-like protein